MMRFSFPRLSFAAVIFTVLSLSVTAQTLTPSEIAAFRAQLVKAQNVDVTLGAKGQCYSNKEAALQANSNRLQETAGELHLQEQKLASELERAKFEAQEFSDRYETALRERRDLENKMKETERQIWAREAALKECKRTWGFLGFLCDFAGEIVGLNGDLRNLAASRQALHIKITSLEGRLRAAHNEKDQAEKRLRKNQMESEKNRADLTAIEEKIKVIKASLSEIRTLKQSYATLRDEVTTTLAEFEGLDPASDRQSVARRLRRESADLNALLLRAQELLNSNGLRLPDGERICAN